MLLLSLSFYLLLKGRIQEDGESRRFAPGDFELAVPGSTGRQAHQTSEPLGKVLMICQGFKGPWAVLVY
jgi:hypothetical protein